VIDQDSLHVKVLALKEILIVYVSTP